MIYISTYFISDLHFSHENVIKYCNRPFKNINEMNHIIIDNILKIINKNDILFILGDIWDAEYLKYLNYFKIYLIFGNHDFQKSKYNKIFNIINDYNLNITTFFYPIKIDNILILSHEPYLGNGPFINIHGHLHNKLMENNIENEKYYFNVSVEQIDYKPIKIEDIFERIEFKFIM